MPFEKFEKPPTPPEEEKIEEKVKREKIAEPEIRSEKELTEEERAKFEEAVNVLNLDRYFPRDTGGEKEETEFYLDAIETLRKLRVREGREVLVRRGLNDRDYWVQVKTAETLGEIGLPQDLKVLEMKHHQFLYGRTGGEEMVRDKVAKAMAKIEKRFSLTEREETPREKEAKAYRKEAKKFGEKELIE